MYLDKKLNERLANFVRLDVRSILKSSELLKEYVELHELIEGFKPACTGCSARSKLASWKKKYSNNTKINKSKKIIMANTFKLKKGHQRLSLPFSSGVITEHSDDKLIKQYLNENTTPEERLRRESFFEVLPKGYKSEPSAKKQSAKKPSVKTENPKTE